MDILVCHPPGEMTCTVNALQTETLGTEKENLLACMETTRSTVRQLEAQNQELQRRSTNLDRDLLTERSMKEQKIKVETRRDG